MRKTRIATTIFAAIIVGITLWWTLMPRYNTSAGIIHFPFYRGTSTISATRSMIFDLSLKHASEQGNRLGTKIKLSAADRNGKQIAFHFALGKAQIVAEPGAEYSAPELTEELARRIGLAKGSAPIKLGKMITRPGTYGINGGLFKAKVFISEKSIVNYIIEDGRGREIVKSSERASIAMRWGMYWDDQTKWLWVMSSDIGEFVWIPNDKGNYIQHNPYPAYVKDMPDAVKDFLSD